MTSRTYPKYPPSQIIERCACITLDELLSRGVNARDPLIKRLASRIQDATAGDCGAHLLEWPDGPWVQVISHSAREFLQLSPDTITAAYRSALAGCEVYRDY